MAAIRIPIKEMPAELSWLPFLLQTADALFPTGAYAHSLGFEESVRLGLVSGEAALLNFLQTQIVPAQCSQELPYLRFAFEAAARGDVSDLCRLDGEIDAWKLAAETRNASVQLGVRRLKALKTISDDTLLSTMENAIDFHQARGHHLIICGMQAVIENVPLEAALGLSFYQALAAICAAALKLIRIGQDGCQRALRQACKPAAAIIARSMDIERNQAGWFNPLLEIASMRHAHADERLFIS